MQSSNTVSDDPAKFRGKYRIESARLKDWDYSSEAAYFITICTKNRKHFFGEVVGGEMKLSKMGQIVASEWQNTEKIRSNSTIDQWIVMPNHLHGIIIIQQNPAPAAVETHCNASLPHAIQTDVPMYKNKFGPQSNNLSAIIRGFKGATTKNIHIAGFADFAWQPRFHDRVIRNEQELNRIRQYIKNNPLNWEFDRNNS